MTKMLNSFVEILIGIVLVPIVFSFATTANVTGTTLTIVTLISTIFALGVLYAGVKPLLSGK